MSREIKFRAWDNFLSCYSRNSKELYYQATGIFGISTGDRYILEQFTDLPDKNGKEIYEGDIIKDEHEAVYNWEPHIFIGAVEWSASEMTYKATNKSGDYIYLSEAEVCEVIGNIHENPELLVVAR